jgi:hypothetical protein
MTFMSAAPRVCHRPYPHIITETLLAGEPVHPTGRWLLAIVRDGDLELTPDCAPCAGSSRSSSGVVAAGDHRGAGTVATPPSARHVATMCSTEPHATGATPEARVMEILRAAKALAQEYHDLTGRPLGITGEVAEYEAVRLLGLEPAPVRQPGYDAVRRIGGEEHRLQVKGRCIRDTSKRSQKLGRIKLEHEWEAVLMVLMDERFDTVAIYEADREAVAAALLAPGSVARNERGALAVSKFKSIGRQVWPPPAAH